MTDLARALAELERQHRQRLARIRIVERLLFWLLVAVVVAPVIASLALVPR